jgi:hypothetical protein
LNKTFLFLFFYFLFFFDLFSRSMPSTSPLSLPLQIMSNYDGYSYPSMPLCYDWTMVFKFTFLICALFRFFRAFPNFFPFFLAPLFPLNCPPTPPLLDSRWSRSYSDPYSTCLSDWVSCSDWKHF